MDICGCLVARSGEVESTLGGMLAPELTTSRRAKIMRAKANALRRQWKAARVHGKRSPHPVFRANAPEPEDMNSGSIGGVRAPRDRSNGAQALMSFGIRGAPSRSPVRPSPNLDPWCFRQCRAQGPCYRQPFKRASSLREAPR